VFRPRTAAPTWAAEWPRAWAAAWQESFDEARRATSERLAEGAGHERLRLIARDGHPIAAGVSQLARDRGWELDELRTEQGRLDDVFRAITTTAEGAGR